MGQESNAPLRCIRGPGTLRGPADRSERGLTTVLPDGPFRKMFSLAGWILEALPRASDRSLLQDRLVKKLTGLRRGKLYLPSNFPPKVKRLADLTTSQLRDSVYWFGTSHGTRYTLKKSVAREIRRAMPGGFVRTVYGSNSVHEWQSHVAKRLEKSDWPRLGTKSVWPSSPTVDELMEMGRRGITPAPLQTKAVPAHDRIHLSEYNTDAALRARIISKNVLGIRSDIKLPSQWLGYFRYRWNFLILATPFNLPAGLVRWLTGQWVRDPHNLWLQDKASFRIFLKKTDRSRFPRKYPGPW